MNLENRNNREIVNALPHKKPFVMVDELISIDDFKTVASLTIIESNIFVKDGLFCEPGLIEHVAQSAGLKPTIEALQRGENVPLGYFASISNFKLFQLPKVETVIETTVINETIISNAIKVRAITKSNQGLICEAEMSFYLS
jgi:3-hydroxyacyl-[acyl-carrier-protein] dehydratase